MKQQLIRLAFCLGLALGAQGPALAGDPEDTPVRVLFVLGSPPFHDIRNLPPILEKVLDRVGGFMVTRLEPPREKPPNDPAHLAKLANIKRADYDVLVFYTSGYNLNDLQEQALERFVEDGGGIVGIHGASLTFGNSRFWLRLLGAKFNGHIPGTHSLNIVIADRSHPITAGVTDFVIIDEEYKHTFADVDRHVLARFKERPPQSDQKANMDIIWTRQVGKGRVFYIALGHGREAWQNPAWQKLVAQGIFWAAGRPREIQIPAADAK